MRRPFPIDPHAGELVEFYRPRNLNRPRVRAEFWRGVMWAMVFSLPILIVITVALIAVSQ